ncbi:MAG: tRNA (cytidine(34)-2'-O)-methyltransferase [Candidatus Nanopelagicales bacterium]
MFRIVLLHPEIPGNTGSIIRLCANTGCELHLIEPLGFDLDDARLRRAGLDYHEYADLRVHPNLDACLASSGNPRVFAFSARATRSYADVEFQHGDVLLFGPESVGLPDDVLASIDPAVRIRLPMLPDRRSLNLSNAASIAVYEGWRQLGFVGATGED